MIWTIKKVRQKRLKHWCVDPLDSFNIRIYQMWWSWGYMYKRMVKMRPRLKRWCLDRSILNIWEHSGPCGLQSRLLPSRNPPSNPKIYFTCKHLEGLSWNVQVNISISMSVNLKRTLTYPPVKTKKFLFNQEKRNLFFILFFFEPFLLKVGNKIFCKRILHLGHKGPSC